MTYYYMSTEQYKKNIVEDRKIIRELNSGELNIDEAEQKLQKLWHPSGRKQ